MKRVPWEALTFFATLIMLGLLLLIALQLLEIASLIPSRTVLMNGTSA